MTDQALWAIYFATTTSMLLHPGYRETRPKTGIIAEAAHLADLMMLETARRFQCRSSQE